jgi:hypothetical protein
MLTDPDLLFADFSYAAVLAGVAGWPCSIVTERLPAPHRQPPLRVNQAAVYTL